MQTPIEIYRLFVKNKIKNIYDKEISDYREIHVVGFGNSSYLVKIDGL